MNHLFIASRETVKVYDPVTRHLVDSLQLDSNEFVTTSLAVSPDNTLLAVTKPNEVIIFDIEKKIVLLKFEAHILGINDITFSPDGRYLATSSYDGTVRLWGIVP